MDSIWTWLIVFALISLTFLALIRKINITRARTVEKYEADVRSGRISARDFILVGILMLEMGKIFKPSLKAAVEYCMDEKQGQTGSQEDGDLKS